jgi:uncharacterized membrane protein YeaQ/YmgE (transglycosylase-associated protein family)
VRRGEREMHSGERYSSLKEHSVGGGQMLSFLSLILFGLVVGVIAKLLMPGRDPGGFIITILLGIAGAVIGGYIGRLMGFYGPNEGAGFFMALLGSILLLALYRLTIRRRTVV